MARRYSSDPLGDLMGNMVMTGTAVVGVVAVMTGVAIAELLHTPTEQKLRTLTAKEAWGDPIIAAPCPHCDTCNEHHASYCYACGQVIPSRSG